MGGHEAGPRLGDDVGDVGDNSDGLQPCTTLDQGQHCKTRNALEWAGLEAGPRLLMGTRQGVRHSRL